MNFSHKNENTEKCYNMQDPCKHHNIKEADTKDLIFSCYIYVKCLRNTNL